MLYGFIPQRYNKLIGMILALFYVTAGVSSSQQSDSPTILILGDSLVQGFGLAQNDGLVNQLESALLDKGINVGLINGGVSGDTTAGGLARLEWSLTDDIDGVVVSLGANDMLRGLPPKHTKDNLSQIIQKLKDRDLPVLLVGIRSIENYGKEYKLKFESIYEELTKEFGLILYPDLLSPILNQDNLQLEKYYQADKLHPNADGVLLIVGGLIPSLVELIELTKSRH